jgi:glycosyltransferase involved in cell wall biosynthesis
MSKRKIRISQCMIVKNEERHIERALSWAKDIVDEQIVVDTGSTDRTVALSEKLGARVFHIRWTNDFSAARNYAIDQAAGDWILFSDADEWCAKEEAAKIPKLIGDAVAKKKNLILATLYSIDDEGKIADTLETTRIFANIPERRYIGKIHETLVGPIPFEKVLNAAESLAILHDGYTKAEQERKWERNLTLIQEALEENPQNAELLGYLGDEWMKREEYDAARNAYQKSVAYLGNGDSESRKSVPGRTVKTLWNLLLLANKEPDMAQRDAEIRKLYEKSQNIVPKCPDFDYFMGWYCLEREEDQDAVVYLERAFWRLGHEDVNEESFYMKSNLTEACENYALALFRTGKKQEAAAYCKEILKVDPNRWSALCLFLRIGRCYASEEELVKLYDLSQMRNRFLLAKAVHMTGRNELLPWLSAWMTEDEKKVIREQLEIPIK